ncbi:MAG TPA: hypothetical protein VGI16_01945 [Candidatus Acidoferrum sp.]
MIDPTAHFTGEVARGERFEKKLDSDLVFRLEPEAGNDSGWTIRLAPEPNPESIDCIGAVSEPLHGSNALSIQAEDVNIINTKPYWSPPSRDFYFVADLANCKNAWDLANLAHYPSKSSDREREEAEEKLGRIATGHGVMEIEDTKVTVAKDGAKASSVESIKFSVTLTNPKNAGAGVDSKTSSGIRGIDLEKFLRTHYAEVNSGVPDLQGECGEKEPRIRKELTIAYGDLDGDSEEEAVYAGYTCMSGTAGIDFVGVVRLKADGHLAGMEIEDEPTEFKGRRDLYHGLRGHMMLEIVNGHLVKSFPIYKDTDGCNACSSGGTREFVYRWDGRRFALDNIVDVPPDKDGV